MTNLQDSFSLSNGVQAPCIGFGTWKLPPGDEGAAAVAQAIQHGYRHIDTAAAYGNEADVGTALRTCGVPRQELFVSGKLWNTKRSYSKALKAFKGTLDRLELEYLDLFLIHWPASSATNENWKELNLETWSALEELHGAGQIRAIGVCNFLPHHLDPLLQQAKVAPIVNQIEFHPGQMQPETLAYCANHGILVEAWGPLGNGKMLENEQLARIAASYGKSTAQLCIRWCLQHGVLPLTKTASAIRMQENAAVFDFALSAEDMAAIDAMPYFGGSGLHPDEVLDFQ